MTTYDLNNPLLIEAKLTDCWIDLQLPTELLQQVKRESKSPSILLKDVHLTPVKPGDGSLRIYGDFDFTLFIGINFDTSFTPPQFFKSLNEAFNKFIPKHQLVSLDKNKLKWNLMENQLLFTTNEEILPWLVPDGPDTEMIKQVLLFPLFFVLQLMFSLLQVQQTRSLASVGDTIFTAEEMKTELNNSKLLGFRISEDKTISTLSKIALTNRCSGIGPKIIIIQSMAVQKFHHVKLHQLFYNHFYNDDPLNTIFESAVRQQVYEYLQRLPFVIFFHLQNYLVVEEDFVGWKFPKKLQECFDLQLCLNPFFQKYFALPTKETEDLYLSVKDLPQHKTGHDNHLQLRFKANPKYQQSFPLLVVHSGSLFMHNFIPANSQANYFKSTIAGSLHMNLGRFDIPFNPSIYIRHLDALAVKQRFVVQDCAGQIVCFDPVSSHVWFEINFY